MRWVGPETEATSVLIAEKSARFWASCDESRGRCRLFAERVHVQQGKHGTGRENDRAAGVDREDVAPADVAKRQHATGKVAFSQHGQQLRSHES